MQGGCGVRTYLLERARFERSEPTGPKETALPRPFRDAPGAANDIERVDVSEPASISSGIAERYATAIFELAKDDGTLPDLRSDLDALTAAREGSDDFRNMIHSPLYSRDQQEAAIGAVAEKMGLQQNTRNVLKLMAQKRRLFVLPEFVRQTREMIARHNGEITADVIAAADLSDEQRAKLAETLKQAVGRDVNINLSVDESLIAGLVVKVGSKMVDTSIRSKLDALQNTMKEVG